MMVHFHSSQVIEKTTVLLGCFWFFSRLSAFHEKSMGICSRICVAIKLLFIICLGLEMFMNLMVPDTI